MNKEDVIKGYRKTMFDLYDVIAKRKPFWFEIKNI